MERAGAAAGLGFPAHPHMLRHACGFTLANKGTDTRTLQAYLGHKNIQHTVRYTELAPGRFKDIWRLNGGQITPVTRNFGAHSGADMPLALSKNGRAAMVVKSSGSIGNEHFVNVSIEAARNGTGHTSTEREAEAKARQLRQFSRTGLRMSDTIILNGTTVELTSDLGRSFITDATRAAE